MAASISVEGRFACANVYGLTYSSLEPPVVAGEDSLLITQRMSCGTEMLLYSTGVVGSLMISYTFMQLTICFTYIVTITIITLYMVDYTG